MELCEISMLWVKIVNCHQFHMVQPNNLPRSHREKVAKPGLWPTAVQPLSRYFSLWGEILCSTGHYLCLAEIRDRKPDGFFGFLFAHPCSPLKCTEVVSSHRALHFDNQHSEFHRWAGSPEQAQWGKLPWPVPTMCGLKKHTQARRPDLNGISEWKLSRSWNGLLKYRT